MANFWDLPKPVREQIYRLHLVQEDPVHLREFEASCGGFRSFWGDSRQRRGIPHLLQVCKRTEREAATIYFSENTFIWRSPKESWQWKYRLWPRHLALTRKVILDGWEHPEEYGKGYNDGFRNLASFRGVESLIIKVDEHIALEKHLSHHPTIKWHSSLGLSPQLHLQTLHFCGIYGLKTLVKIPQVEFPPLTKAGRERHGDSGAIPGGVLDTLVRREIARSPCFRP